MLTSTTGIQGFNGQQSSGDSLPESSVAGFQSWLHRSFGSTYAVLAAFILTGCSQRPPSADRPAIYDATLDGEKQIADALLVAKREARRVLIQFGANWCSDCHAMHALFRSHPGIAATLKAGYVVVLIDVDSRDGTQRNAASVARYGVPIENGIPALVILDSAGEQLTTRETNPLRDDDHRHPEKVLAFLRQWMPPG